MKKISFLLFILSSFFIIVDAQTNTLNQLDGKGQKTGIWKQYYSNGKLKYEGTFKNGKPIGLLKRYYEGGIKKAELFFTGKNEVSYARLYYENGDLAAEGKFVGHIKDSTWNYYSFYNQRLAMVENYRMGKKDGVSISFFDNDSIAEKIYWKNDIKQGKWEQFYPNGETRLKCWHIDGKRDGLFSSYAKDGSYSITGFYKMGKMDGKWTYYLENNEVDLVLEYSDGKMKPNPEYEKRQKEFAKLLDEGTKSLAEPNSMEFR